LHFSLICVGEMQYRTFPASCQEVKLSFAISDLNLLPLRPAARYTQKNQPGV
jgi:hypothetical protein